MHIFSRKCSILGSALVLATAYAVPAAAETPASATSASKNAARTVTILVNAAGARRCELLQSGHVRASLAIDGSRFITVTLRFLARLTKTKNERRFVVTVSCPPRRAKRILEVGSLSSVRISVPTSHKRVAEPSASSSTPSGAHPSPGPSSNPSSTTLPQPTPPSQTVPTQGIFDDCDISTILSECQARVATIATAGLKVDVQPLPPYGPWLAPYLETMSADGVQGMWEIDYPGWWGYNGPETAWGYSGSASALLTSYPSWTAACGCQTNEQLLAFIVDTLVSTGATYGWYVADDSQISSALYPTAEALSGIGGLAADLRALAPNTTSLMSAWGLSDTTQLAQAYGLADLTAQEAYPLFMQATSPTSTQQEAQAVAASAGATQELADSRGGPSSLILQSFSWGECDGDMEAAGVTQDARYPNADEMLAMRNAALLNSRPQLVLWYTLEETIGWPNGDTPTNCRAPIDPDARLAALTAAVTAPYPTSGS